MYVDFVVWTSYCFLRASVLARKVFTTVSHIINGSTVTVSLGTFDQKRTRTDACTRLYLPFLLWRTFHFTESVSRVRKQSFCQLYSSKLFFFSFYGTNNSHVQVRYIETYISHFNREKLDPKL